MNFTSPQGLRIWRVTGSELYGDEAGKADAVKDDVFARIAAEGFNAIWIHTLLYTIMDSKLLPQLNDPTAPARIAALRKIIERAAKHNIAVFLYINDPQAVDGKHRLWTERPELKGHEYSGPQYSLCTALPAVREFFAEAAQSALDALPGLGGVILITSCEHPTHCWSKSAIRLGAPPTNCARCKSREPAESVLPLINAWAEAAKRQAKPPRILAWNWEWAYWYEDPQEKITTHLPAGVELLLDNEIGGHVTLCGRPRVIREYSLAYAGPSERFELTRAAVAGRVPIHAKIEFNATHEMCSVPNIPVLATIHARLRGMYERDIAGFLGCWSMSSAMTLNTAALRVFLRDPKRYLDADALLADLAREYLGVSDAGPIIKTWRGFGEAWKAYPTNLAILYTGPHNDAPARKMSLHYEGKRPGRSWQMDAPGDDLSPCLGKPTDPDKFTLDEVIDSYSTMTKRWNAALPDYEAAIGAHAKSDASITDAHRRHRFEELSTAKMIGLQLQSITNAFAFHRERMRIMSERKLEAPCEVPIDAGIERVMRDELGVLDRALPLVDADPRLGFHLDCGTYKYSAPLIRAKKARMLEELSSVKSSK